jgi:GMP synthase (glutamine-hydrolysing)
MGLRFLVIEGNTAATRAVHASMFGVMPSQSYARTLGLLAPDAISDIACPADPGANLPDAGGLEGYDGIFLTGSALHIYRGGAEVTAQIELMREVYRSGVPAFGSCWGLQIGAVAAGGDVRANPKGQEVGFARNIAPTMLGRSHPLLAGRPDAFDAPAIHQDAVVIQPADCCVLAFNASTPVQAAEIRHDGGTFWGVQYHPEYALNELAVILSRMTDTMVEEGFTRTPAEALSYTADLSTLHADKARTDIAWRYGLDDQVLNPTLRLTEISNFIAHRVRPVASARGRA